MSAFPGGNFYPDSDAEVPAGGWLSFSGSTVHKVQHFLKKVYVSEQLIFKKSPTRKTNKLTQGPKQDSQRKENLLTVV